ncbi:hypothetical protein [Streptomyces sp. UH6]|uniref:hypothetical protein n=1 Tax=Streptomyces sp. UH6 TaxID=2748379 RepID=UPI0015D48B2E|nr:hypothetical protein [Streptomyces sp. UH6]NYV76585.1 hypothetical protein [Streptomyces sp. UH6]
MTEDRARLALERLRSIDWADDAAAYEHANSRGLLMREFLRRTAAWARAHHVEPSWPFLDVVELVAPEVEVPADVAAEVEDALKGVAPSSLKETCRAAVRWAALVQSGFEAPAELPAEPYEPLLLMCERGGGYFVEEFIDLNGAMVRLGTVDSNLAAQPFLTLASTTLDALDAEGDITYYAKVSEGYPRSTPRGIVRRRVDEERTYDEAFTRNLRWESTEYLRRYELGHNDVDHVEISTVEAARFIESAITRLSGTG